MKLPHPICFKCNKEVYEVSEFKNIDTGDVTFYVMCHGEIEKVKLSQSIAFKPREHLNEITHRNT